MESTWLLLIYSVPAEPSRKRAHVWRALKRIGAVYLRDGVCVLPECPDALVAACAIAASIEEFEGQVTLVHGGRLEAGRATAVVARFHAARAEEYAEIAREAERLLKHLGRETEHRDITDRDREAWEADLGKLNRWTDQVRARDYLGEGLDQRVQALLRRCAEALAGAPRQPMEGTGARR